LAWPAFIDLLWETVDEFVPYSVTRVQPGKQKSQPRELRKLVSKKRSLWKKLKKNPSSLQIQWEYRDYVHKYRDACFRFNKVAEMQIIESENLGAFYKHVNRRIKHRSVIPPIIDSTGVIVTTDENKANTLNEYFASVGVADNGSIPTLMQCEHRHLLETVVFDEYNVSRAVLKLKANLSAGPDGLPPLLFKRLRFCIAKPLAILFTQLFSFGFIPQQWKNAIIVPVFKKRNYKQCC